ncbi:MAG TPA: ABC transporter ATP-binding protein [Xanthobacteraceae bacterium]|nr:ABC transporter ATP-binding protein [Xanthobacteraceae bacterium]
MSGTVNSNPDQRSLRQLLRFTLRGHWPAAGALFLLLLFTSVMEGIGFSLVIPLLQAMLSPGELADGNVLQRALAQLSGLIPQDWRIAGLLGLLIFVFSLKSLGLIAASGLTRWFVTTLRMNWVVTAFLATIRAPYSEVAARPHGETLQNIIGETETAARGVLLVIEAAARVIQITVLLTILLLANWQATLFVLALGAAAFALSWRNTGRLSINAGTTRQAIRQRANDVVSESITGLRTVKLLDIAGSRTKHLRQMLRVSRRVDTLFEVVSSLPSNMIDLIAAALGSAVIIFMTVVLGVRIEEAIPTTALFGLVFMRLASASGYLFSRRLHIATSLPSLWVVRDMMATAPEQTRGSAPFTGFTGGIVFEDITLQPPGRPTIFDGLTMRIAPVGLTAIIGPSGSGKTTLVDLIVRLREPDRGRILVGGRDIREFDVRSLRARVGYLSQDPQLFNGTVAENLLLGRPGATEAEMLQAASHAHVHEFVSAMEQGYATPLGRGGLLLSGGQRQRLALARELLRDPDLYIFDEPTSALDQETEAIIGELINELSRAHPVVIISHRPDVISGAHVIYRIERGKAVQMSLPELPKVSAGSAP